MESTMSTSNVGYEEADCGLVPLRNTFLLPTAKLDDQKFEFYFLLDASGSMGGEDFTLATRALSVTILHVYILHIANKFLCFL